MNKPATLDLGAEFAKAVERCGATGRDDLLARLLEEFSAALRAGARATASTRITRSSHRKEHPDV